MDLYHIESNFNSSFDRSNPRGLQVVNVFLGHCLRVPKAFVRNVAWCEDVVWPSIYLQHVSRQINLSAYEILLYIFCCYSTSSQPWSDCARLPPSMLWRNLVSTLSQNEETESTHTQLNGNLLALAMCKVYSIFQGCHLGIFPQARIFRGNTALCCH